MGHGITPARKFVRYSSYALEPANPDDIANRISGADENNSYRVNPSVYATSHQTPEAHASNEYGWALRTLNDIDLRLYLMEQIVTNIEAASTNWDATKTIAAVEAYVSKILCDVDTVDGYHWSDIVNLVGKAPLPKSQYEVTGDLLSDLTGANFPEDMCYDNAGFVYITSSNINPARVYKVDLSDMTLDTTFTFASVPVTHRANCLAFDGENIWIGFTDNAYQLTNGIPTAFGATRGYYIVIDTAGSVIKAATQMPLNALNPSCIVVNKKNNKVVFAGSEGTGAGGEQGWLCPADMTSYNFGTLIQAPGDYGVIIAGASGGQAKDPGGVNQIDANNSVLLIGRFDDGLGTNGGFLVEYNVATDALVVYTGASPLLEDTVHDWFLDICYASEKYWIVTQNSWNDGVNTNLLELNPQDLDNAGALKYVAHLADWEGSSGDPPVAIAHDGFGNLFISFFDFGYGGGGSGKNTHITKHKIYTDYNVGAHTTRVAMRNCVYEDQAGAEILAIAMTHSGIVFAQWENDSSSGRLMCNVWGS